MASYPISFWVVIGILMAGAGWSFQRIKEGIGIPMLAVVGTVAAWYVGDAIYNDYANSYAVIFDSDVLDRAWWEVALFLVTFLVMAPVVHRRFNGPYLRYRSGVYQLAHFGVNQPFLQRQLNILFGGCLVVYAILVFVAAIRVKGELPYFFFPFLGHKAEPWGRDRIGSGIDALLSFALYMQMISATVFGVIAALSYTPRVRSVSILLCFVSWPYFLFDRTRNTILAVVIPPVLSWIFLRLRGGFIKKGVILAACYMVLNAWMGFIIQNRSNESIAAAFKDNGFNIEADSKVHHEGLNMFEELCWINTFIKNGTYKPNWGTRYFAELVNPIPRVIWHGKPLIGLDYAIARGQGGGNAASGSVYATVSTGLIGQGIVNFGGILGSMAAALLMCFWTALLARQDLLIRKLGRIVLYALGLILTFNLGRDVTFITLYPFVFLLIFLRWYEGHEKPPVAQNQMAKCDRRPYLTGKQSPNQVFRRARRATSQMPPGRRKL